MNDSASSALTQKALLTIAEAGAWASEHLGRRVTASNISYLVQYGKITRHGGLISRTELAAYYAEFYARREQAWKAKLGADVNWRLSFEELKEADTTKHVHRLHPYKGKFIPQLVEYFLDSRTDEFKREVFFRPGDVVLDPFAGSGTTVVQANELGLHGVGVDVSAFNALLGNTKLQRFDAASVEEETSRIAGALRQLCRTAEFDAELTAALAEFNAAHFPAPDFKRRVARGEINDKEYARARLPLFLPVYQRLTVRHGVKLQTDGGGFLDKWYLPPVRAEIDFAQSRIKSLTDKGLRDLLSIILSRAVRSCRATTHSDLATLKTPVAAPYYCVKHGKICRPLFSLQGRWRAYSRDTVKRLNEFAALRTDTHQRVLAGDSRTIDLFTELDKEHPALAEIARRDKIRGIFSSPPYVGLIDYHEQHAYAYELFGLTRRDADEIGPLFQGQGKTARESYVAGIAAVLTNCRRFLADDCHIFLVANDKHDLYPRIAERAGLRIVNRFKRPVLNRTERDKGAYAETIFHLTA
jgi:hypothetical protein